MLNDSKPPPLEQIGVAVAIAALSSFCAGLVGWGIYELKEKFGSKPATKKPEEKKSEEKAP